MLILAAAFTPMIAVPNGSRFGELAAVIALIVSAAVLAVGSAAVFPFEMDTVVSLANNRLVGTHYGFYNTIVGIGILAGNLATGALMQAARIAGREELVWLALTALGFAAAAALYRLDRTGRPGPQVTENPNARRVIADNIRRHLDRFTSFTAERHCSVFLAQCTEAP